MVAVSQDLLEGGARSHSSPPSLIPHHDTRADHDDTIGLNPSKKVSDYMTLKCQKLFPTRAAG